MSGWFKFVQTEDGSVPAVFHDSAEDSDSINFKKGISAAFQANFKRTSRKIEADPQSLHVSEYTYVTSPFGHSAYLYTTQYYCNYCIVDMRQVHKMRRRV